MTTIVVRPADRYFAGVFNVPVISVGAKAKACWGAATVPVDLAIVIDRSSSMSAADLTNAKNAAKSVLSLYDPALQHLAFGVLGGSSTTTLCTSGKRRQTRTRVTLGPATGRPSGFSTNYKTRRRRSTTAACS